MRTILNLFRRNIIATWIIASLSLILWSMIAVMWMLTKDLATEIRHNEEIKLKTIIESSVGIIKGLDKGGMNGGGITTDQSKALALRIIREMRYDNGNYFFIYDYNGDSILNPVKPDIEGSNFMQAKDSTGLEYIAKIIDVAKAGGGYVQYNYVKPATGKDTPKLSFVMAYDDWNWVIGSGVYLDDVDARVRSQIVENGILMVVVFIAINAMLLMTLRAINRPIRAITKSMTTITTGNLEEEIPYSNRIDSIGEMSKAVAVFRDNARQVLLLEEKHKEVELAAKKDKEKAISTLINQFHATVGSVIHKVAESIAETEIIASNVANTANLTNDITKQVAQEAQEASVNVQAVASATEELSISIHEISSQVSKASTETALAVDESTKAHKSMNELVEEINKVNDVTEFITKIAHETNLLALNATIEAARAGEAGKGFNVVAHEVKGLANQTASATTKIADQLGHVHDVTSNAVIAIDEISGTIQNINSIASSVAAAVEEQNAATGEIARSVSRTSDLTSSVSQRIDQALYQTSETHKSAEAMLKNTKSLSTDASRLRSEIDNFLNKIKNL